jgi:hypothetical protein
MGLLPTGKIIIIIVLFVSRDRLKLNYLLEGIIYR